MVETPVLFETFVRIEYARQVWDAIKAAQPKTLYFYSNKGRVDKEGEIEKNNEIRSWINEIDWECDLHTWFREECVNVYDSLRGAISWLFENEEEGIILEDDCVPTKAFFSFCDQMIVKFRDDKRVWCISGDNWFNYQSHDYDYHFSHYHFMYGWASWRSRWEAINWQKSGIQEFLDNHMTKYLFERKEQIDCREKELIRIKDFVNQTKCWDYFWGIFIDQNNGLTVHPKCNLITNIGVSGAHHESNASKTIVNEPAKCEDVEYKIVQEPPYFFADAEFDYLVYKSIFKKKSLLFRIRRRLFRILGIQ